jgi:hypothetical protein
MAALRQEAEVHLTTRLISALGHKRSLARQKFNYFNLDFPDAREAPTAIPPPKIGNCWKTYVVLLDVPATIMGFMLL